MSPAFSRIFIIVFSLLLISFSSTAFSTQPLRTPAKNSAVQLESEGSLYWLHFDKDADTLWPLLQQFWENEGIAIKKEQPELGFMETDWIQDPNSKKIHSVLLTDQAPEFRERFRLRLEPLPDNKGTRVFIYHSSYGILFDEEAVYTGYLPPSPELEIEMLSRLALFSGADKKQIKKKTSTYIPIRLQANAIENNQFEIRMPGSMSFVNKKLIAAMDRLSINFKNQTNTTYIATITTPDKLTNKEVAKEEAEWGIDDSSDLEEEGFDYNPDAHKDKAEADSYSITLSKEDAVVAISIQQISGNTEKNEALKKFSDAIARNLNR